VVVAIDDVIDKKMEMYHQHTSQMYEWLPYNRGALSKYPKSDQERLQWLSNSRRKSNESIANKFRDKLIELYGEEKGKQVKYAEAFELSEYGTSLNESNLKTLFPFFK
jgi:N-acetylglucosamine malate deacetylase 1